MFLSHTDTDMQQMWQCRTQSYSVEKLTTVQVFEVHLEVFFKEIVSNHLKQLQFYCKSRIQPLGLNFSHQMNDSYKILLSLMSLILLIT